MEAATEARQKANIATTVAIATSTSTSSFTAHPAPGSEAGVGAFAAGSSGGKSTAGQSRGAT
eukprot:5827804-Pleurochrysis_carterae.AAC.1